MAPECVDKPTLPASSLPPQHTQALRHLGPADRVGDEADSVALLPVTKVPVHPNHQLHVLANRVRRVASRLNSRTFVEQPEGAGDDEQTVPRAPAHSPEQKGAQILDDL